MRTDGWNWNLLHKHRDPWGALKGNTNKKAYAICSQNNKITHKEVGKGGLN